MNHSQSNAKSDDLNWVSNQNEAIIENQNIDLNERELEWEPEDDIPIIDLIPLIDLRSNE